MVPVIHTTYGMAMGQHPEVLAASGGLRPGGAERLRERPTGVRVERVCRWLRTVFARVHLRHRDAYNQPAGADRMSASALPSSR